MFKLANPLFLICETPLHAGSGSDLGIVDLPIQRERHTDFPKIEGSSLKGGIREAFEELVITTHPHTLRNVPSRDRLLKVFSDIQEPCPEKDKNDERKEKKAEPKIKFEEAIDLAFGPDQGDLHAGALGFTDARLLLFPVKSMKGVFVWITCPFVLEKLQMDLDVCYQNGPDKKGSLPIPAIVDLAGTPNKGYCAVPKDAKAQLAINNNVLLEEYAFEIKDIDVTALADQLSKLTNNQQIKDKLVVLSNDEFRDFVMLSTEVITRIKINNETGTVQDGALFTEEYLPTESILYSLALTTPIFNNQKGIFDAKKTGKPEERAVMDFFQQGLPDVIQLGGNATIGKGIVRTSMLEGTNHGK